jgi:peptidyl-dipeptidase A
MASFYEQACPVVDPGRCMGHDEIQREMQTTRDPARLRLLWEAWYNAAAPQAKPYREYVELLNQGARDSGRRDAAEVSLAAYAADPAAFKRELDALWDAVRPLYRMLHAYARARLVMRYPGEVDPRGPIPMHLLGNLWGQEWDGVAEILLPGGVPDTTASDRAFAAVGINARGMVEIAARFFQSLGFPPLPASFWDRSHFERPSGPDGRPRTNFACHPTAWMLQQGDWRLSGCLEPTWLDFLTAHHETGHIFYFQSLAPQPLLFREAPNPGINEAIGDAVMLSVTPAYLRQIGLASIAPGDDDINALLRVALGKVARIPFGLALQHWRWDVQAGRIPPERYNDAWWERVRTFQGLAPPGARPAEAFDPAAKQHIATNTDYVRYILADVLTFQIHAALAEASGCTEPLHRCSVYGSREAGARLRGAMAMGASRPWQDVLEAMSGSSEVRGEPLRRYLAPLEKWLAEQTKDVPMGW